MSSPTIVAQLGEQVVRAEAGQRRPSSSTSISVGMTLTAEPPRTIVALTVLRSVGFERPALLADQPQRRAVSARVEQRAQHGGLRRGQRGGHRLDHRAHDRRHVRRRPLAVERRAASLPSRAIVPPRIGRAAGRPGRAPSP